LRRGRRGRLVEGVVLSVARWSGFMLQHEVFQCSSYVGSNQADSGSTADDCLTVDNARVAPSNICDRISDVPGYHFNFLYPLFVPVP
jgi:hypothetical protein